MLVGAGRGWNPGSKAENHTGFTAAGSDAPGPFLRSLPIQPAPPPPSQMGAGLSGGQADDNDVEGSGFLSLSQRSAYHFIYACHSYYDKPMRKGYGHPFYK